MPRQKTKTKNTKAPAKKATQSKKTTIKASVSKENFRQSISERLRLDESYASLILGALVVVFLIIFLIAVMGGRKAVNRIELKMSPTPTPTVKIVKERTYILQDGEGIWDVAVKFYGDGFKWILISNANNLSDPDNIVPGTKLIIP